MINKQGVHHSPLLQTWQRARVAYSPSTYQHTYCTDQGSQARHHTHSTNETTHRESVLPQEDRCYQDDGAGQLHCEDTPHLVSHVQNAPAGGKDAPRLVLSSRTPRCYSATISTGVHKHDTYLNGQTCEQSHHTPSSHTYRSEARCTAQKRRTRSRQGSTARS